MNANNEKHQFPRFALIISVIALLGLISAVVTDIIGSSIVKQYSPVADTISDLAAGQKSWIHDTGLQLAGLGIVICAISLYFWHLDSKTWRWKIACGLIVLIGIDLAIIAGRNIYGDGVSTGIEIHKYLVLFLGLAIPLSAWLLSYGMKTLGNEWSYFNRGMAISWLILAPLFALVPDSWDGAYERFLGLMLLGWLIVLCILPIYHHYVKI